MEVYVYMMRVDDPLTEKQEQDLKKLLSAARQKKIEKLRYGADRRLSLGAGLLLDHGLKRYGLREQGAEFGTVENGKPCLLHYPEIQFNLSHSGNMVMAAFSSCPVGCDVEKKQEARMKVAQRFFAPSEQKLLLAAEEGNERNLLFSRLWTLKESFLKVDGRGMAMPLDSFSIEFERRTQADPEQKTSGTHLETLENVAAEQPYLAGTAGSQYLFKEFSLEHFCASVCVKRKDPGEDAAFFFSFQTLQDMV